MSEIEKDDVSDAACEKHHRTVATNDDGQALVREDVRRVPKTRSPQSLDVAHNENGGER